MKINCCTWCTDGGHFHFADTTLLFMQWLTLFLWAGHAMLYKKIYSFKARLKTVNSYLKWNLVQKIFNNFFPFNLCLVLLQLLVFLTTAFGKLRNNPFGVSTIINKLSFLLIWGSFSCPAMIEEQQHYPGATGIH